MTDDQPEQPVSRPGYPWYGWILGIWCIIPLPLMFLGLSSPQARRHLNKWAIIGYSGLAYVALIIMIFVAAAAGGSDEGTTEATTPSATSPPMQAPVSTEATSPSPTSRPTPTPIPTVKLCERFDVRVYFARVNGIIVPLSDTFAQISTLSYQMVENPWLIEDSEWRFEVGLNLGTLQLAADEIRALPAPHEVQLVHDEMMELADAMHEGATLYARGLDNVNAGLFGLAAERYSEAARLSESFTEKKRALCQ